MTTDSHDDGTSDTGLEAIGRLPWGSHVSLFYDTKKDLLDVLTPYFKAGLQNNECGLWVVADPLDEEEAVAAFRSAVHDADRCLNSGCMEIAASSKIYLDHRRFVPERVIAALDARLARAVAQGYAGLRATGNESWLTAEYWEDFRRYEAFLDEWLADKPILVLCTYPLGNANGSQIFDVARTHDLVMAKRGDKWETLETRELKQAKRELARLNQELEARIAARTTELADTVLDLREEMAQRTEVEKAVRENHQLMRLVLETLPVGVAVMDPAGDILLINDASKRIWGGVITGGHERWTQTKAFWHDSGERIQTTNWASIRALRNGETSLNELIDIETYDGRLKIIRNSAAPIRNIEGGIVGAVIVNEDVSDRVRAEEALGQANHLLRILARRNVQVQEGERRRLARELHDQVGQLLTAATINVQSARESSADSALTEKLGDTVDILDTVLHTVRKISFALRPAVLDDLGLAPALRWMLSDAAASAGLRAEFLADSELERADVESETACYRVATEAVTNVIRHANAEKIMMELRNAGGCLRLRILDNGRGFDVAELDAIAQREHLGLTGMRERTLAVGGEFKITSDPGKGTEIVALFPISSAPDSTD